MFFNFTCLHPSLTQLSGVLERRKIKHVHGKWEIHKNIGQKTQRNETLCRLGRKTATYQPIKTWFTVSDNAFKSLRLESRSRFPSSSQKILALFAYWLRFVLSRLRSELSCIAERVIERHPVSNVACLLVTLTNGFVAFLSLLKRVSGRKIIYIPYLSVINKVVSHYLILE
jgi:hypothetical protein